MPGSGCENLGPESRPKAVIDSTQLRGALAFAMAIAALLGTEGCSPPHPGSIIICFGDSITAQGERWGGYVPLANALLSNACPGGGWQFVAAGVSGNRVPDLERRLDAEVLARKPHACVVYIGINDVWHKERGGGTPKAAYETGMHVIVDRMQAAGIQVFLCTPSVIGEKPAGANPLDSMLDDYAEVTRAVAAHTGATLIDLRRAFQRHLEAHNPHQAAEGILTYDGVHLNAAGHRLVAQAIAEQVVKVIPCTPAGNAPAP